MKKQSRTGCFVASGVVVLVLLALGGIFILRALPSVENMVPESPIIVDLLAPDNGAEPVVGDLLSVQVKAFSAENPLAGFELWVDGQLFAQEPATGNAANAGWSWQALGQGVHTLFVRAIDGKGRTGQSQVVIINVLEGAGVIKVPAQEGQTLDEIGAQFGAPPDQMTNANPGVDPSQPLQAGQPVQVPAGGGGVGPESGQGGGQSPSGGTQEPKKSPAPLVFWIGQKLIPIFNPPSLPQAPKIALTAEGCNLQVYIRHYHTLNTEDRKRGVSFRSCITRLRKGPLHEPLCQIFP